MHSIDLATENILFHIFVDVHHLQQMAAKMLIFSESYAMLEFCQYNS